MGNQLSTVHGKGRKVYLDAIRIIAILLVIFNHTGESGFVRFVFLDSFLSSFLWLFASIACKVAVPLFFMASGAVLLGREEDLTTLYKRRIFRFLAVLVLFTILQYMIKSGVYGWGLSFGEVFSQILAGQGTIARNTHPVSYWYLYAYLAMLVFLPFLRAIARSLKTAYYWYLIILSLAFNGVLPVSLCFLNQGKYVPADILNYTSFLSWWVCYPLLGYFFDQKLPMQWWSRKKLFLGLMVSFACLLLTVIVTKYHLLNQPSTSEGEVQAFHTSLIMIPACFIFIMAQKFFDDLDDNTFVFKMLVWFGGLSFSVMLMENFSRKILRDQLEKWQIPDGVLYCLLLVMGAYFLAGLVGAIMKLIPGFRKLL